MESYFVGWSRNIVTWALRSSQHINLRIQHITPSLGIALIGPVHAFYRQILLIFLPWNFRPGFAQRTTGISTSNHHSNTKNQKLQALTRSTKSHKSLERCVNFHVAFMPRCRISERRASRTRTSWDEVLQTKQDPMKKPISLPSWLLLAHGSQIIILSEAVTG